MSAVPALHRCRRAGGARSQPPARLLEVVHGARVALEPLAVGSRRQERPELPDTDPSHALSARARACLRTRMFARAWRVPSARIRLRAPALASKGARFADLVACWDGGSLDGWVDGIGIRDVCGTLVGLDRWPRAMWRRCDSRRQRRAPRTRGAAWTTPSSMPAWRTRQPPKSRCSHPRNRPSARLDASP